MRLFGKTIPGFPQGTGREFKFSKKVTLEQNKPPAGLGGAPNPLRGRFLAGSRECPPSRV